MVELRGATVPEIFNNQVNIYGAKGCVAAKDFSSESYKDISWIEMGQKVSDLAAYLVSAGVMPGDRVALFSANRPEWWIADLAIQSAGAVNVPVYPTNSIDETDFILRDSGSVICFVDTIEHFDMCIKLKKDNPVIKKVILFDNSKSEVKGGMLLDTAIAEGAASSKHDEVKKRTVAIKSSDPATIIYTSGTTGNPKGVVLTQNNFISDVGQIMKDMGDYISDRHTLLSFLPLSHSLERTAGYYLPMMGGARVAFAEEFSKVVDNMKEVRPTFIVSVPRLYEKIHSTILSRLPEASAAKKMLFAAAMNVAKKNMKYVCIDKKPPLPLSIFVSLFDKLVYSRIKEALGMDKLEFAVSGGAPLALSDAEFFIGMGLKIIEGFGLTETTPVTNVNLPWNIKPGTIGPALSDTEVKISDEGEYLIKGPQVMAGYYNNPEATANAFTHDGFFKTGDLACIDDDGYVTITGRIKDIIVTAGGKNISPQNIENSIKGSQFIEHAAIIGDRRKYLSALIIPSFDNLEKWALQKGIKFTNRADLLSCPEVIELFNKEIADSTAKFARVEQIRRFTVLADEWTIESGEITPSLKVKRRVIEKKYKNEIEAMYEE